VAPGNRNNPRHPLTSDSLYRLVDFRRHFPDDEICLQWLWHQRYSRDGTHAFCQRCEAETAFKRYQTKQQRQSWTCTACGLHMHPTAGTIFHKSSTGLHLWFYAAYLMTSTGCGISAKQLERELGVTYKTAHRMSRMIRTQLSTQDDGEPLDGAIEVDETSSGAKLRLSDKAPWKDAPTRAERLASQKSGRKKALRVRRDRALRPGPRLPAAKNLLVGGEVRRLDIEGP
jgi:transposase-like protein